MKKLTKKCPKNGVKLPKNIIVKGGKPNFVKLLGGSVLCTYNLEGGLDHCSRFFGGEGYMSGSVVLEGSGFPGL